MAAAFPSACGKTNFAMMIPPRGFDGWKMTTIGDDIAWIKPAADGCFHAINPEAGYFGVAPGTSYESNPNAMETLRENVIFTNVALTDDGDVWWEGMTEDAARASHRLAGRAVDARLRPQGGASQRALHGRGDAMSIARSRMGQPRRRADLGADLRRAALATPCRSLPRRASWEEGVYKAATMGSETTAAAAGAVGEVRRDPVRDAALLRLPRRRLFRALAARWGGASPSRRAFFASTGSARASDGKFVWPGFGQNMRVLQWIVERCAGRAAANETAVGFMPAYRDLDWRGIDFDATRFDEVTRVDAAQWTRELASHDALFDKLGTKRPGALADERVKLGSRLRG